MINGDYCASLDKRHYKLRRGVLVQQDDVPVHICQITMAVVKECGFEVLSLPPYLPGSSCSKLTISLVSVSLKL